jgi:hypothetical protein
MTEEVASSQEPVGGMRAWLAHYSTLLVLIAGFGCGAALYELFAH